MKAIKLFIKQLRCKHEYYREECYSNNFTWIGWTYTNCIKCGKKYE